MLVLFYIFIKKKLLSSCMRAANKYFEKLFAYYQLFKNESFLIIVSWTQKYCDKIVGEQCLFVFDVAC